MNEEDLPSFLDRSLSSYKEDQQFSVQDYHLEVFAGRKFKNDKNECFAISIFNTLLSSKAIRKGILVEKSCQCKLCKYLYIVLIDPSLTHLDSSRIRKWVASFNKEFRSNGQQDAEEFLCLLYTSDAADE